MAALRTGLAAILLLACAMAPAASGVGNRNGSTHWKAKECSEFACASREVQTNGQQLESSAGRTTGIDGAATRRPIRFVGGPAPAPGIEPDSVRAALDAGLPGATAAPV